MENSKLQDELLRIPENQRDFTGKGNRMRDYFCEDACIFGIGKYSDAPPLETIPPETKGLYFYYGAGIKGLLEEVMKLELINTLEYLTIGITHNNDKYYSDYSEISALLSNIHFPQLKFFEYGVDELIANEHCIYGNLFNITDVLGNMPQLEKLYLYGNFELKRPVSLRRLTDLEVLMDDWATHINGGKISNDTLQNLLSSEFDALRLMSINLDFNDENYDYTLPQVFLDRRYLTNIRDLELEGKFRAGTKLLLTESALARAFYNGIDIRDIDEPV